MDRRWTLHRSSRDFIMDCGRARGFERTLPGGHHGFGVLLRCRGGQLPGGGTSRHGNSGGCDIVARRLCLARERAAAQSRLRVAADALHADPGHGEQFCGQTTTQPSGPASFIGPARRWAFQQPAGKLNVGILKHTCPSPWRARAGMLQDAASGNHLPSTASSINSHVAGSGESILLARVSVSWVWHGQPKWRQRSSIPPQWGSR